MQRRVNMWIFVAFVVGGCDVRWGCPCCLVSLLFAVVDVVTVAVVVAYVVVDVVVCDTVVVFAIVSAMRVDRSVVVSRPCLLPMRRWLRHFHISIIPLFLRCLSSKS